MSDVQKKLNKSNTRKNVWVAIAAMCFAALITGVMVIVMIKPLFSTGNIISESATSGNTNNYPDNTATESYGVNTYIPETTTSVDYADTNIGVGTAPNTATNTNSGSSNGYASNNSGVISNNTNSLLTTYATKIPETTKKSTTEKEPSKPAPGNKVETPSKNNSSEYQNKLEAENQRHKEELEKISSEYDVKISDCEYMVTYNRNIGGYVSSSYYDSQIAQLQSDIYDKERKLDMYKMDTSGAYKGQARQLEAELQNDYARLEDLMVKQGCVEIAEQYERERDDLKRRKQYAINYENELHNTNITEIKNEYNK